MASVADHYGEIVVTPFEFALTDDGLAALSDAVIRVKDERDALVVRVGVEGACLSIRVSRRSISAPP